MKKYSNESKKSSSNRKRKAKGEAREAEQLAKEMGISSGEGDLRALILQRKGDREK
eukprot:CAMPEP_0201490520 /NCGR_PEP_ID=MMETSP0151_2-20130828/26610_1 /ASSEMBLY_ACC=CAM_ASM_000257 /TAXON_ID=200890 /ORGANISM="Paramoeba atlantica, Strain 621/1 / CCAP 1560/9" /LENGTH=55 /DNA_ID=CAMNT_0047876511 /DNA_START=12 /DNA_END=176 /DNA_ORIENTATION=-